MTAALRRLQRSRRARELASDRRAGAWSGGEARRLQYKYVRNVWLHLVGAFLFLVALTPSVYLMPAWARSFTAGAWLATATTTLLLWVVLASGSASRLMGQIGEQSTAGDLRRLQKQGWRLVNHVYVGPFELDHVVVGPAGLVVIESKWTGWARTFPDDAEEYTATARRLARHSSKLARTLRHVTGGCPVRTAVVVWGPEVTAEGADIITTADNGVDVMPGRALDGWLDNVLSSGPPVLEPERIDQVWGHLEREAIKNDDRERSRSDHPTPIGHVAADLLRGLAAGFAAVIAGGTAWQHLPLIPALVASAALVALGVVARRMTVLRTMALGWTVGIVGLHGLAGVLIVGGLLLG